MPPSKLDKFLRLKRRSNLVGNYSVPASVFTEIINKDDENGDVESFGSLEPRPDPSSSLLAGHGLLKAAPDRITYSNGSKCEYGKYDNAVAGRKFPKLNEIIDDKNKAVESLVEPTPDPSSILLAGILKAPQARIIYGYKRGEYDNTATGSKFPKLGEIILEKEKPDEDIITSTSVLDENGNSFSKSGLTKPAIHPHTAQGRAPYENRVRRKQVYKKLTPSRKFSRFDAIVFEGTLGENDHSSSGVLDENGSSYTEAGSNILPGTIRNRKSVGPKMYDLDPVIYPHAAAARSSYENRLRRKQDALKLATDLKFYKEGYERLEIENEKLKQEIYEAGSRTSAHEWYTFFRAAGISRGADYEYAILFEKQRIRPCMLKDFDQNFLENVGITESWDIYLITKHAMLVYEQTQGRTLVYKSKSEANFGKRTALCWSDEDANKSSFSTG